MSTWVPAKSWKRGRGSVSRQIQIVKRKRRRVVSKAAASHHSGEKLRQSSDINKRVIR